jgi:N-methylhydantoinase B
MQHKHVEMSSETCGYEPKEEVMRSEIDPVLVEVISNNLLSIAEQAGVTLIRCAFSPNIKERRDCSTALLTADGKVIAQATHIPMHLGSMLNVGTALLEKFGAEGIRPGDVFLNNDPFLGGSSHLPDLTIITPIFFGGELVFFALNTAHHVDVGGRVPGSTSPDCLSIYEEGIRIPMVKLVDQGMPDEDLLNLIAMNCRDPRERIADIQGQIAANYVTDQPIVRLCEKYGIDVVKNAVHESLDSTERKIRARISEIPDGSYGFVNYLDNDGVNNVRVPINVTVNIRGDQAYVDFTGTGPQAAGAMNAVRSALLAGVYFAFRAAIDPSILPNEGFFKVINVFAPLGTILNPLPNAAVGVRTDTIQKVVDVVLGALFQAMPPERVIAGSNAVAGAWLFSPRMPEKQGNYTYLETVGGGSGARSSKDGLDTVHVYVTNTSNLPVESLETEYPLVVERYEMIPDSGGAGKFRGGLGIRRDIRVLGDTVLTTRSEGHATLPWGILGGKPGAAGGMLLHPDTARESKLPPKKSNIPLQAGDIVSMRTPGGGGFGDPSERHPDLVREDIANGFVSAESAERDYGYNGRTA